MKRIFQFLVLLIFTSSYSQSSDFVKENYTKTDTTITMRDGVKLYTIIYVPDVAASLDFFTQAFGIELRLLHESGAYAELETGQTTLAIASHDLGEMNFPAGYIKAHTSTKPLGIEIGLVTDDVPSAHKRAVSMGAIELSAPAVKPWGQVVSYVRCPDGSLVELCTPVGT